MRRINMLAVFLAAVLACGCSQHDQNPPVPQNDTSAITSAIQQHLREDKGINMSAMEIVVGQVTINGDLARADAEFRLKEGGTTMAMTYSLERHASGWIVAHSQPTGGQFAHPPMDQAHSPVNSPQAAPAMPDLTEYLKNHPSPKN